MNERARQAQWESDIETERVREETARAAKAAAIAHAWASTGQPSSVLADILNRAHTTVATDDRQRARKALQLTLEVASVKFSGNPNRARKPWTEASSATWRQALAMLRFDEEHAGMTEEEFHRERENTWTPPEQP